MSDNYGMKVIQFNEYEKELWEQVRQPLSVTIEITPKCNFNCIHCYLLNNHFEESLSYDDIIHILDILYEHGVMFITFTGGEVFTRSDFLDIYVYAKKLGFFVGVFTNGYSISDDIIKTFVEYPPLLVDISLYGASDKTYYEITQHENAFSKVLENCYNLKQNKIRFSLKSPVIRQSYNDLENMKKIASDLGVDFRFSFDLSPTLKNDKSIKSYEVSLKEMFIAEISDPLRIKVGKNAAIIDNDWIDDFKSGKEVPLFLCKIAVNDFFIDYLGKMCPCASFRSEGIKLEDNFDEIWESFGKYKKMKASPQNKCISCDSRYFCKVCPAEQYTYYGDFEAIPESLCKLNKARKQFFKDGFNINEIMAKM